MNPQKANLINAITLILVGLWGYVSVASATALIPVGFGLVLLCCYGIIMAKPGSKKIVAHIAILFTLILLFALAGVRLPKSLATGGFGLARVLIMISTCLLAIGYFIKNFIDNKKNNKNA